MSVFNRCVPEDVACYAEFAQELVTFISDNNAFRRVVSGVMASKEIILGLCLLALGTTHTRPWFTVLPVSLSSCARLSAPLLESALMWSGPNSPASHPMRKTARGNFSKNNRKCLSGFLVSAAGRHLLTIPVSPN